MIRVIAGPDVSRGEPTEQNWRVGAVVFTASSTAAGAVFGAALGALGDIVPDTAALTLTGILGVTLLLLGSIEVLGGRPWLPQRDRETPGSWLALPYVLRNATTASLLGIGVTTRAGYVLTLMVPVLAFLSGSAVTGLAIFATYSLTRGVMAALVTARAHVHVASARVQGMERVGKQLLRLSPIARQVSGFTTVALSVFIIV